MDNFIKETPISYYIPIRLKINYVLMPIFGLENQVHKMSTQQLLIKLQKFLIIFMDIMELEQCITENYKERSQICLTLILVINFFTWKAVLIVDLTM